MKLKNFRVTEFKSIRDSGPVNVEDITCLVGKNESGKTALLSALYKLNPIEPAKGAFDSTEEYPRGTVGDYNSDIASGARKPATVVTAVFTLEPRELAAIASELGDKALWEPDITVTKGYDNVLEIRAKVQEPAIVQHLVSKAGIPAGLAAHAGAAITLAALGTFLTDAATAAEGAYTAANTQAAAIPDETERAKAVDEALALRESSAAGTLRGKVAQLNATGIHEHIKKTYLSPALPRFLYFDEYYQLAGALNIEALRQRQAANTLWDSDRPMLGLLALAGLTVDDILSSTNTQQLRNKIEGASNTVTKQILPYWSQNANIRLQFDPRPALAGDPDGMKTGTNLWGLVYDIVHDVTVGLGTRSRGFVWFFSFVAWFSQYRRTAEPLIVLLDEPGLFLHAKAQADLLRFIETELKTRQVIYTTHSPFAIDPKHLERVRIVRDRSMEQRDPLPADQEGTKVLANVFDADQGTLFPLQGALAYDITQTFFVGPNSLLVEGAADLLYLQIISTILSRQNRTALDPRWTITPVGGSDKVPTFAALLGAQKGLKVAALLDVQKKDEQKIDALYRQRLLEKQNIHTFASITGTKEADIEDMFDVPFYLKLFNGEYHADLTAPVAEADLTSKHPRVLVRLGEYLAAHPFTTGVPFSHYRPARYFSDNLKDLEAGVSATTLDRFETAFKRLNALL